MKYLLTPITMILWYLITYYGFYYAVFLMLWMFNLNWIWLIIGFPFLIGIISGLTNGLPSILKLFILKLYGTNWFTTIAHTIAGLVGVIMIFIFFKNNPTEYIDTNQFNSIINQLWNNSPIKTIILFFPFIGLIISLLYSAILSPITLKYKDKLE